MPYELVKTLTAAKVLTPHPPFPAWGTPRPLLWSPVLSIEVPEGVAKIKWTFQLTVQAKDPTAKDVHGKPAPYFLWDQRFPQPPDALARHVGAFCNVAVWLQRHPPAATAAPDGEMERKWSGPNLNDQHPYGEIVRVGDREFPALDGAPAGLHLTCYISPESDGAGPTQYLVLSPDMRYHLGIVDCYGWSD